MNLNDLERKFFEQCLTTELSVPVSATLKCGNDEFDVVLVPVIDEGGDFRLKYYGVPQYDPENGVGTKTFSPRQALGSHPSLERAWLNRDPVTVRMYPPRSPFNQRLPPELLANVLYPETGHRGTLVLRHNRVALRDSLLTRAEFCVIGFPDFMSSGPWVQTIAGITTEERDSLQSIQAKLEHNATISIRPPAVHSVLDSGNGWIIKLTRDDQPTRDIISHMGLIQKSGEETYEVNELGNVLEGLKYFFGFVVGAYRHPTVVIGFDGPGQSAWGQVGNFKTSSKPLLNWFNNNSAPKEAATLESVFPRFWYNWTRHRDEIISLIECYVHSNAMRQAGVPQDAIAKSFTGLEILASLELGETIRRDSSKHIHKVLAGYKIPNLRLTASETPTISRLSKALGESSMRGVHLLGNVRNYVAHPLDPESPAEIKELYRNHLDSTPLIYTYLHDLSQFYLEYGLLRFFGYNADGSYRQLLEAIQRD